MVGRLGFHPSARVLGWKGSTTKSISPALVIQHPLGPASASVWGEGTAAGKVTATEMPLRTLLCALGCGASPGRSSRPGKGESCPAPGPHSPMCSWALKRLGEALSLGTLGDVGPASLSPSWKQLVLPSPAQSPLILSWSHCLVQWMLQG